MQIPALLREGIKRQGLSQKFVSITTKIKQSTLSNYTKDGYDVPINKIITLTNAIDDDETRFNVACQLLETIPAFNGSRIRDQADSYFNFAKREEREEQAELLKNNIQELLSQNDLSDDEREKLHHWTGELLDEVLMELATLIRACKMIGMSIAQLIKERFPIYVNQRYMKGDKEYAQSKLRRF